jgi:photosystem II stability/assembly factor-like uncharacterized protein
MYLLLIIAALVLPAGVRAQSRVVQTDQTSGTSALLIAVSPVNENVVWASGAEGTWLRTTDGGATWQAGRVAGADSLQFRDVHAVDENTAYLLSIGNGTQSRIYRTTDAGRSWTLQFTNTHPQGFYDCFDFWDAERGIVIGDAIDGQTMMLITTDGGAHWTQIAPETLPRATDGEGSFAASGTCVETGEAGHAWIVASNPEHGRMLHTEDHGQTWSVDTLPISTRAGAGPQSVSFRDARNGVALGGGNSAQPGDTLVATTDDGGSTWTTRTRPPMARGIWGGMYIPGTNTIVAVGPDGAVYSEDDGVTWLEIDRFNYWSVGFASPAAGWAVGATGRITKLALAGGGAVNVGRKCPTLVG